LLIAAAVNFSVARETFDARTFCQLTFIGVIAIAIVLNVTMSIIAIAVRATLCAARCNLALHLIRAVFVLMCANLFAELVIQFEMSALFNTLEPHAFECAVNLVLVELRLKELGDTFKRLSLKLLAGSENLLRSSCETTCNTIGVQARPMALACRRLAGLWRCTTSP
jgi:hypothetical protein